ncbi:MAG: endonuclease/exonuclease/phosphatase family protein [Chitinophagaceae bacterium]
MRKYYLLFLAMIFSLAMMAQELNVMTFNLRYSTMSDSANAWVYRKDKVASQILFQEIQLLGVQEALHEQMMDMSQRLPRFHYVGVGRDDGKEKGEYSAIFYDTARLQVLQSNTFWLSETPDVPGKKGWDAAFPRIVTWAKFRDRKTKKIFFAFNTHFDHIGKVARRESAKLLLQKIKEIAADTPSIITGDFNAKPTDEPIQVIADANNPLHLTDTKAVSLTQHYGPAGTFTAFGPKEIDDLPIDHIFIKGKWTVLKHATISESWQGRYASDHFSVMTVVKL